MGLIVRFMYVGCAGVVSRLPVQPPAQTCRAALRSNAHHISHSVCVLSFPRPVTVLIALLILNIIQIQFPYIIYVILYTCRHIPYAHVS